MKSQNNSERHIQRYAASFGSLHEDTLDDLSALLAEDVRFTDPFNAFSGKAQFMAIFQHMFKVMHNPHFEILDIACSDSAGYIKWRMGGHLVSRPSFDMALIGMSEVHFDNDGLVTDHIDHWDSASQLLVKIPVAGRFVRMLMRLFAH